MTSKIRVVLLLALALGLGFSPASSATRLCVVSLDECCEVDFHPCGSDSHPCESGDPANSCDKRDHDCCLVVLSDETMATVPDGSPAVFLVGTPVLRLEVPLRAIDAEALLQAVVPDPPPLLVRERLARIELFLI